jgi:amyloid beta precursor protein binding protein 1
MHAAPDRYGALQAVFKARAARDAADVLARARQLRAALGLTPSGDSSSPSSSSSSFSAAAASSAAAAASSSSPAADGLEAAVQLMCRHSRHLRVLRFSPLAEELDGCARTREALAEAVGDAAGACYAGAVGADGEPTREAKVAEQAPVAWYLMLRAADRFAAARGGRFPGTGLCVPPGSPEEAAALAADADALWQAAQALCAELGLGSPPPALVLSAKHAAEFCRFGASEPHAVAAYLGGVAAQEAVKLLTCMFVPIDNTFVYSGGLGLSAPLRL